MTVGELIDHLSKYKPDMKVASIGRPHDELEVRISHYESDNPYDKNEFDFVAID